MPVACRIPAFYGPFFTEASMTKKELYDKAMSLPLLPGVYIIRDKHDEIIYIGKAKRL